MNELEQCKALADKEIVTAMQLAESIEISNEDQFKQGVDVVESFSTSEKKIEDVLGKNKEAAYAAYKSALNLYKMAMDGLKKANEIVRTKINLYITDRKTTPSDDRVYFRTDWYAEVKDMRTLCQAIASGKAPVECVVPNEKFLKNVANSLKDTAMLAGVEFDFTKILCIKTKKDNEQKKQLV